MPDPDPSALVARAAGLLRAVAYGGPATSPAVRLPCLHAVELLDTILAPTAVLLPAQRFADADFDAGLDAGSQIGEALALLASLPPDVFGQHAVLEAAAAARDAYQAAG